MDFTLGPCSAPTLVMDFERNFSGPQVQLSELAVCSGSCGAAGHVWIFKRLEWTRTTVLRVGACAVPGHGVFSRGLRSPSPWLLGVRDS